MTGRPVNPFEDVEEEPGPSPDAPEDPTDPAIDEVADPPGVDQPLGEDVIEGSTEQPPASS